MGIIIKARGVINSLLKLIFIVFLSVNLANMISMEQALRPISYFLLLLGSMCLFQNMVLEDFMFKTVDIRKAAILMVLLCIASTKPITEFIYIICMSFLFFRSICILSMILSLFFQKPDENENLKQDGVTDNAVPFLPCFAAGIVFMSITMHISGETSFFQQFLGILEIIEFTLIPYLGSYVLLEITYYFIKKHYTYEAKEGIGMGDVIVLPSFAAFLGIPLFTISFVISIVISIVVHIAKLIIGRNNACH